MIQEFKSECNQYDTEGDYLLLSFRKVDGKGETKMSLHYTVILKSLISFKALFTYSIIIICDINICLHSVASVANIMIFDLLGQRTICLTNIKRNRTN